MESNESVQVCPINRGACSTLCAWRYGDRCVVAALAEAQEMTADRLAELEKELAFLGSKR